MIAVDRLANGDERTRAYVRKRTGSDKADLDTLDASHLMPDDEDRARAVVDAALGPHDVAGAAQTRPKVVQAA